MIETGLEIHLSQKVRMPRFMPVMLAVWFFGQTSCCGVYRFIFRRTPNCKNLSLLRVYRPVQLMEPV